MASVIQTSEEQIVSFNPATGEEVGRVPQTSDEEVRAAVAHSREVFHNWKTTSFAERRALVMKAREVILAELDEIAHLISAESGKPFGEAMGAVLAGGVLGFMALRSRSIAGGVLLHVGSATLMDMWALYRKGFFE